VPQYQVDMEEFQNFELPSRFLLVVKYTKSIKLKKRRNPQELILS